MEDQGIGCVWIQSRGSWPDLYYLLPQNLRAVSPDPEGGCTPCRGTVQTVSRWQGQPSPAGQGALRLFLCGRWCHPGHSGPSPGGSAGKLWAASWDGDWGTPVAGGGHVLWLLPGLDHHPEMGARGMKPERVAMGIGVRDVHPHSPAVEQPAQPYDDLICFSTPEFICLTLTVLCGKSQPSHDTVQGPQCLSAQCLRQRYCKGQEQTTGVNLSGISQREALLTSVLLQRPCAKYNISGTFHMQQDLWGGVLL